MTPTKLRDAAVGLVYIVVIAALITLSIMIYNHDFTTSVRVTLRTDNVGSALQKGSDVKVRGVPVGQVQSISSNGSGARVHLLLEPGKVKALPSNMQAQLLPKTLFGERYVSLVFPSDPNSSRLRSGDTIEQDTSKQSIQLEQLFSDLLPVLQAVKPEKLSATLGELSAALRGRGNDLAQTVQTIGQYLDKLAPQVPQITADLKALADVATTYTQAAPDLIDALDSMTSTSQTILSQRADLTNLLASATSFAHTVGTFVNTNEDQIISLSRDSLPSLRIVAKYAAEFPCLSQTLVNFIPTANRALGLGTAQPGAHVILHVVPASTPYTSADKPTFDHNGPPRCPYSPATALASTALRNAPGVVGASAPASTGSAHAFDGMGTANSPEENELITELVAPTVGLSPQDYPRWASLLLGPALRGAQVSVT